MSGLSSNLTSSMLTMRTDAESTPGGNHWLTIEFPHLRDNFRKNGES